MPSVFLSPSLQENNAYTGGGNEEYYMNLVADAMIPYLDASGITVVRSDISGTLGDAIAKSNAGNYDLHLAIHSNAAPESLSGQLRGTDVYYYTTSVNGKRAAEIFANNFKLIYPQPSKVCTVPTTTLAELRRTRAPAILIEVAYHDNVQDATWIRNNIEAIARNLSASTADYLGVQFIEP